MIGLARHTTYPSLGKYFYKVQIKEELLIMINENKIQMYIVRSLSMTNWLCNNGHKILKVEDSEKDPRFKVFFFEDTAALHNTMKRFKKGV